MLTKLAKENLRDVDKYSHEGVEEVKKDVMNLPPTIARIRMYCMPSYYSYNVLPVALVNS